MDEHSESNGRSVGGAAEVGGRPDLSAPTSKASAPKPASRARLMIRAGLGALFLIPLAWWLAVLLGADAGARTWAEHAGSAGDSVAWLTASLTAGALFAALWSVRLQGRELALQREEMAASKTELARQASALEEQLAASRELGQAMQAQAAAMMAAIAAQESAARDATLQTAVATMVAGIDMYQRSAFAAYDATENGRPWAGSEDLRAVGRAAGRTAIEAVPVIEQLLQELQDMAYVATARTKRGAEAERIMAVVKARRATRRPPTDGPQPDSVASSDS